MTKRETKNESDSGARQLRRELFSDELVDQLLASAGDRGVALTGPGGFLPEMIKSVLERGMGAQRRGLGRPGPTEEDHHLFEHVFDSIRRTLAGQPVVHTHV